jgi:porin
MLPVSASATRRLGALRALLALAALGAAAQAHAQPVDVPPTWGGDMATRPRLTGDWDGTRDAMGKKGIVLDVDLLLTPQSVLSGGRSTGTALWGNLTYTLNVDSQKAGLWRGGFLKLEGMSGFGNNVVTDSGAVIPVNTAATLPALNEHTTALTNATFTQFLSEKLGVMIGKINTLDLGATEFYGDYNTQFWNMAFLAPMTLEQVPISAWGAGIVYLPTQDLSASVFVLNPDGTPTTNPVFGSAVEIQPSLQLTIHPFGLVGHQSLAYSWNDKERYSLTQDPANLIHALLNEQFPRLANPGPELIQLLEQYAPGLLTPPGPPNTTSSSWAFSYGFDQYLWQPANDPAHGVGVFFAYGASDGNPNPLRYSLLLGVGGKGVVPGRGADSFGVGFASTRFSSEFLPLLRSEINVGLERENAFEAYYEAALTGWLNVGADVQIVRPGLDKRLIAGELANVGTAYVVGVRLRARF